MKQLFIVTILSVAKADKSKWHLVHDLRAVNEVVEDWPAEVPNPHTLLSNVPPAANYYTVIDLCSALFSVPLAQGWGTLILEGHSPAEFSSNPEKPWKKNT